MQANEVLKIILGLGNVLSGKLLCYDALSAQSTILTVKRNETEVQKVKLNRKEFLQQELSGNCAVDISEVSIKEILQKQDIQFIDVRELHEQPKVEAINPIQIPLSELNQQLDKISKYKTKGIFCQSGIRSRQAIRILHDLNFQNCYNIKEGASEINRYIKECT